MRYAQVKGDLWGLAREYEREWQRRAAWSMSVQTSPPRSRAGREAEYAEIARRRIASAQPPLFSMLGDVA